MKMLASFIPSIDNLSGNVKDVSSILTVPVFGHKEKNNKEPIAILQFINKLDHKPITDFDIVSQTLLTFPIEQSLINS